jgi:hypothetical protein
MWAKRVCLAVALLFAVPVLAQAQTGRVTGTLLDSATSQPVANARITVVGTTIVSGTNSEGRFTLNAVPAGTHEIRIQRIGFTPITRTVIVGSGSTATLNVAIEDRKPCSFNPVVSVGYGIASG